MQEQNFKNHAKFVPAFHFFVGPVLMINVVNSIVRVARHFDYETAFGVLLALALLALSFLARTFALRVQDRVIRLEMRLRLRELLSADLQHRIAEFLPALARKVLDENLADQRSIKQLVQSWQPDHLRA